MKGLVARKGAWDIGRRGSGTETAWGSHPVPLHGARRHHSLLPGDCRQQQHLPGGCKNSTLIRSVGDFGHIRLQMFSPLPSEMLMWLCGVEGTRLQPGTGTATPIITHRGVVVDQWLRKAGRQQEEGTFPTPQRRQPLGPHLQFRAMRVKGDHPLVFSRGNKKGQTARRIQKLQQAVPEKGLQMMGGRKLV